MPKSKSGDKQKPTARKAAAARVAERPGQGKRPKVGASQKQRSQGRFPGETPLTGEDRPANKRGGKKEGLTGKRQKRAQSGARGAGPAPGS